MPAHQGDGRTRDGSLIEYEVSVLRTPTEQGGGVARGSAGGPCRRLRIRVIMCVCNGRLEGHLKSDLCGHLGRRTDDVCV